MVKHLPIVIVSLIVFGGGIYGGQTASVIAADAFVKAAPVMHPTCKELMIAEAEVRNVKDATKVIDEFLGPVREELGITPAPFPSTAVAAAEMPAAVTEALGAEMVHYVMCNEYPCVAVIRDTPLKTALQPLRDRGIEPLLVDVGRHKALVLPMQGWLDLPPEEDDAEGRAVKSRIAHRAKSRAQALSNALVTLSKTKYSILDDQKAP